MRRQFAQMILLLNLFLNAVLFLSQADADQNPPWAKQGEHYELVALYDACNISFAEKQSLEKAKNKILRQGFVVDGEYYDEKNKRWGMEIKTTKPYTKNFQKKIMKTTSPLKGQIEDCSAAVHDFKRILY